MVFLAVHSFFGCTQVLNLNAASISDCSPSAPPSVTFCIVLMILCRGDALQGFSVEGGGRGMPGIWKENIKGLPAS